MTKKDLETAKVYYERALACQGNNSRILQSYSALLAQMNDFDNADKTYLKGLEQDPENLDLIRSYAHYLSAYKHDHNEAEKYNLQALNLAHDDPYVLINYSSCLLLQNGKEDIGIRMLEEAITRKSVRETLFFVTVAWVISFIHLPSKELRIEALEHVKYHMIIEEARLPNGSSCNLECNIAKAIKEKHPDSTWLQKLVDVFVGEQDISYLENWKTWASTRTPSKSEILNGASKGFKREYASS